MNVFDLHDHVRDRLWGGVFTGRIIAVSDQGLLVAWDCEGTDWMRPSDVEPVTNQASVK